MTTGESFGVLHRASLDFGGAADRAAQETAANTARIAQLMQQFNLTYSE
jgi:hypothetical protein